MLLSFRLLNLHERNPFFGTLRQVDTSFLGHDRHARAQLLVHSVTVLDVR